MTRSSDQRELVETLDRIIAYEHYYHSVYGHFTKVLNRLGVSIPHNVTQQFEIRVAESSTDRLLLTGFSEMDGKVTDMASIDQDFQLRTSFPVPAPRPEYLRMQAIKLLRGMRDAPAGQSLEEQGVYRGYFKFDVRPDSQARRTAIAVGIKPPVVGMQLEVGPSGTGSGDEELLPQILSEFIGEGGPHTGEKTAKNTAGTNTQLDETYLAQRIFFGEIGRYAKNWSELSKIANFRFQAGDGAVPFGDADSVQEIDAASPNSKGNGDLSVEPIRSVSSVSDANRLEIEAVTSEE